MPNKVERGAIPYKPDFADHFSLTRSMMQRIHKLRQHKDFGVREIAARIFAVTLPVFILLDITWNGAAMGCKLLIAIYKHTVGEIPFKKGKLKDQIPITFTSVGYHAWKVGAYIVEMAVFPFVSPINPDWNEIIDDHIMPPHASNQEPLPGVKTLTFKEVKTAKIEPTTVLMDLTTQIEEISIEEILALQDKLQNTNPKYPLLDLNELVKDPKYVPKYKMQANGATFYCSAPLLDESTGHHKVVLGLVEAEGKVYPRIFYQSDSQGTWRVMPAGTKAGAKIVHFGKGLGETDVQLPQAVNFALHELAAQQKTDNSPVKMIKFEFPNVIKTAFKHSETYPKQVVMQTLNNLATNAAVNFFKWGMLLPIPPDPKAIKMPANKQLHPNFAKPVSEKKLELSVYGPVTAKVFLSHDKSIAYTFYETKDGKAFLAAAELLVGNPVGIYGVRGHPLELEGMDAPLMEYRQQIVPKYEPKDFDKKAFEKYASNWNYVRELEIIQMYYKEQGRKLPQAV